MDKISWWCYKDWTRCILNQLKYAIRQPFSSQSPLVLKEYVFKTDLQLLHHTHTIIKIHTADSLSPQITRLPPFYHISALQCSPAGAVTVVQPVT